MPLTRSALSSNQVRHEVVIEDNGTIDVDSDPQAVMLMNLELENKLCCSALSNKGFDGDQLRLEAPKIKKVITKPVTRPQSAARIQAIASAKAAGQMFHATGGEHLNSDDYFKSRALIERTSTIKQIETDKQLRLEHAALLEEKNKLIAEKGCDLTVATAPSFITTEIKTLLKWKIGKKPNSAKATLVQMYVDAPNPSIVPWTNLEDDALNALKNAEIELKYTALAVSTNQMENGIKNKVSLLKAPERRNLLNALINSENEPAVEEV